MYKSLGGQCSVVISKCTLHVSRPKHNSGKSMLLESMSGEELIEFTTQKNHDRSRDTKFDGSVTKYSSKAKYSNSAKLRNLFVVH